MLGVDPGLGRTGVALVEGRPGALRLVHAGCIETGAHAGDAVRLLALSRTLGQLAGQLHPDVAAVERLYFSTNRQTAMRVSEARGVILSALAAARLPIAEYGPNEVKESIAGYGAATKRQVMTMCAALLGADLGSVPDDAADACAIAVCHHHRAGLGHRMASGAGANPASGSGAPTVTPAHPRMTPGLEAAVAEAQARRLRPEAPVTAPAPADVTERSP